MPYAPPMGLRARIGARTSPATPPIPERPPGWWDLVPFETHRIELAPGVWTIPDDRTPPLADARTTLVLQCLGGDIGAASIVDLGANEGGFTLAFAQMGAARAVGVEARSINVQRAELARALLGVERAEFVVDDVKDALGRLGVFDVVFASGILYHLSDPAAALAAMRAACSKVAVIDTHIADPEHASHGCSGVVEATFAGQTYRGRMFPEYDPSATDEERERFLWAAWSDAAAFWPLEDDLVRMIHAAGFARVGRIDPEVVTNGRHWAVDPTNRVCYLAWV